MPETEENPLETVVEFILTVAVVFLVIYVVYVEFNLISCVISLALVGLCYVGFGNKLKELANRDEIYWTMIGTLIVFVSSFDATKDLPALYLMLGALFIVCILSFFVRTIAFALISLFLFVYFAVDLLRRHWPTIQAFLEDQKRNKQSSTTG